MKIFEKIDRRSKGEQFFLLTCIFVAALSVLCLSGCSSGSCNLGTADHAVGITIPGCAECASCKLVYACGGESGDEAHVLGYDFRYYDQDDGCLGCIGCGDCGSKKEKSCYGGCLCGKNQGERDQAFYFGDTDSGELAFGCVDGSLGCECSDSDTPGAIVTYFVEWVTGID